MAKHPYPELHVEMIGDIPRLLDDKGNDVTRNVDFLTHLAKSFNAVRHVHFPYYHVPALERDVKNLAQLRKEAWDEVLRLKQEA